MNRSYKLPQADIPEGVIHLGLGQPGNDLLPGRELAKAAVQALKEDDPFYLAYGEGQGNARFRQVLSSFLTRHYPEPVDTDHLFVTNGNSQALEFICSRFTRPGDTVFVEEPSYFLALKIFKDHQLRLVTVPVDDQGLCTGTLKKMLNTITPAFIYTIPTHHNPAGVTLSEKRRRDLISICRNRDLLLIADEVYHFLTFSKKMPTPMGHFVSRAPVISMGSFSKILAPGLRLGWMHGSRDLIRRMINAGVVVSGGGLNPFTSQIVETFIRQGNLDANIDKLNLTYHRRLATLADEIKARLPGSVSFERPNGGYFVWIQLPGRINAVELRKAALDNGVDFFPGTLFSSRGELKNYIRLAFCFYDEPMLVKGLGRLAETMEKC